MKGTPALTRAETRRLALHWSQLTPTARAALGREYLTSVPWFGRPFAYLGWWSHVWQMNRWAPRVARDHGHEYRR